MLAQETLLTSLSQVKDEIYIYSKEGKQLTRLMPDFIGSLFSSARHKDTWFFVNGSGFTTPGTLGRYDFTAPEGQQWSIYGETKVKGLNPSEFTADQVGSHNLAWSRLRLTTAFLATGLV